MADKLDANNVQEINRLRDFYQRQIDEIKKSKTHSEERLKDTGDKRVADQKLQQDLTLTKVQDGYAKGLEELRDRFTKSSEAEKQNLYNKLKKTEDAHQKERIQNDDNTRRTMQRVDKEWNTRVQEQEKIQKLAMDGLKEFQAEERARTNKKFSSALDEQNDSFKNLLTDKNREFNEKLESQSLKSGMEQQEIRTKLQDENNRTKQVAKNELDSLKNQFSTRDETARKEEVKRSMLRDLKADDDTSIKVAKEHERANTQIRAAEEKVAKTISQTDREVSSERANFRQSMEDLRHQYDLRNEVEKRNLNRQMEGKVTNLTRDIELTKEQSARQHRFGQEGFSAALESQNQYQHKALKNQEGEFHKQLSSIEHQSQQLFTDYVGNQELKNRNQISKLEDDVSRMTELFNRRVKDRQDDFNHRLKLILDTSLAVQDDLRDKTKIELDVAHAQKEKEISQNASELRNELTLHKTKDSDLKKKLVLDNQLKLESQDAVNELRTKELMDASNKMTKDMESIFNDTIQEMRLNMKRQLTNKDMEFQNRIDDLQRQFETQIRDVTLSYEQKLSTQRTNNNHMMSEVKKDFDKQLKGKDRVSEERFLAKQQEMETALKQMNYQQELAIKNLKQTYNDKINQIKENHLREMERFTTS